MEIQPKRAWCRFCFHRKAMKRLVCYKRHVHVEHSLNGDISLAYACNVRLVCVALSLIAIGLGFCFILSRIWSCHHLETPCPLKAMLHSVWTPCHVFHTMFSLEAQRSNWNALYPLKQPNSTSWVANSLSTLSLTTIRSLTNSVDIILRLLFWTHP